MSEHSDFLRGLSLELEKAAGNGKWSDAGYLEGKDRIENLDAAAKHLEDLEAQAEEQDGQLQRFKELKETLEGARDDLNESIDEVLKELEVSDEN